MEENPASQEGLLISDPGVSRTAVIAAIHSLVKALKSTGDCKCHINTDTFLIIPATVWSNDSQMRVRGECRKLNRFMQRMVYEYCCCVCAKGDLEAWLPF